MKMVIVGLSLASVFGVVIWFAISSLRMYIRSMEDPLSSRDNFWNYDKARNLINIYGDSANTIHQVGSAKEAFWYMSVNYPSLYPVSSSLPWGWSEVPKPSSRDWEGDFHQKNGFMAHNCMECRQPFYGHESRTICIECDPEHSLKHCKIK